MCVYRVGQHEGRLRVGENIGYDLEFVGALLRFEHAHAQDCVARVLDEHHEELAFLLLHALHGFCIRGKNGFGESTVE